jgi:integrase/recombinase XerD
VTNDNERYFFYDGKSQPESMGKSWDRVFRKVSEPATPRFSNCHPHLFRDTFAVSLLPKGVSPDNISKPLGHTQFDQDHRAALRAVVKARQDQLEAEVRRI